MPTFDNGETGLSVRNKLNTAITRTERVMIVDDATQIASLVYDLSSQWGVAAGMQVVTAKEGFLYEVLASDATTFDIQLGAVKLDLMPSPDGTYNFRGMIPAANGSTDDYPLLAKLLAKPYSTSSILEIKFPRGNYRMGSTIDLRRPVKFIGSGGFTSTTASQLTFSQNTSGICVNRFNTDVNGLISPTGSEADSAGIQGLYIYSLGGTDRTKHGIVIRARAFVFNTHVADFPGDGIHIQASAGLGGAAEGNANSWSLMNIVTTRNKNHGLYVNGDDSNAGTALNVDASSNGRYGIWDSSFLGNTYIGCHVAANGTPNVNGNSSIQSSLVSFGGLLYAAHWDATEAQLVATQPGTNSNIWIPDFGIGGAITWTAGRPEGTYFVAFGYRADNANNNSVFMGCYSESSAAGNVFQGRCLVLGGQLGSQYAGDSIGAMPGGTPVSRSYLTVQNQLSTVLTDGSAYITLRGKTNELEETWRFKRTASGGITFNNADLGARTVFNITGLSDAVPWKLSVADFLNNGVREGVRSAAPTTEFWPTGSYVRNSNVASGQPRGWRCTAGGTPGTWVADSNWP